MKFALCFLNLQYNKVIFHLLFKIYVKADPAYAGQDVREALVSNIQKILGEIMK